MRSLISKVIIDNLKKKCQFIGKDDRLFKIMRIFLVFFILTSWPGLINNVGIFVLKMLLKFQLPTFCT
jgi:hypothetical protein